MALQNYIKGISISDLKEVLKTCEYRYSLNNYSSLFKIETNTNYIECFREDLDVLVDAINKEMYNDNSGLLLVNYYDGILEISEKDYAGVIYNTIYMNDEEMYKLLTNINKHYKYVASDETY